MAARRPVVVKSDRSVLLAELRQELLGAIQDARTPNVQGTSQPAAVASLSKELRAVQAEIDAAQAVGEVSKADDLAQRRAARRSAPADSASTSRRSQPRRSNGSHRAG